MRRHRGAGLAAVLALHDGTKLLQAHAPLPHFQQGADNGAHHVAQKTVGLDAEHQQAVLLHPARLHDLAVVGLHLGVHLRETREVVVLEEHVGGLLHLVHVEVAIEEEGVAGVERVLRACDVIMVGARHRVEAGMQLGADLPDTVDRDVVGQEGIHLMGQGFGVRYLLLHVEMGVVVTCVDTRVGAAAARDGDGLSQLEAEALLQGGLHAGGVRLDLVTVVTAAVVSQMDEITWHRFVLCRKNM